VVRQLVVRSAQGKQSRAGVVRVRASVPAYRVLEGDERKPEQLHPFATSGPGQVLWTTS